MKKHISIVLLLVALCTFGSCGTPTQEETNSTQTQEETNSTQTQEETNSTQTQENDSVQIKSDLANVRAQLGTAVINIDAQSSFLLEHWGNVSFFGNELFNKSYWEANKDYNSFVKSFGDTIYVWRDVVDASMSDALETIRSIEPTDETKDYYEAVKEYYTVVSTYRNMVEKFPEGYSKLTYSQAVTSHKEKISAAESELNFY